LWGQALLRHGEPRLTQDIDITLGVGPAGIPDVLAACSALELGPVAEDPAEFARRTFVLPAADPDTGIRVDFILPTTPFEQEAIARAVRVDVSGVAVPYATAEDLILHNLFAGRARDMEDAKGIVARQGGRLDWAHIKRWASAFSAVAGRESLPDRVHDLRSLPPG
jgi:hypothetical protein